LLDGFVQRIGEFLVRWSCIRNWYCVAEKNAFRLISPEVIPDHHSDNGFGHMASRPLIQPGAFGPEEIAAMVEALEASLNKIGYAENPEVMRERIAQAIMAAAKLGERDPVRLREAGLGSWRDGRGPAGPSF
jgi:hypothetical protein